MVEPTAVEVMAQTLDARVTLISCHPYLIDDHRIVVSGLLQSQRNSSVFSREMPAFDLYYIFTLPLWLFQTEALYWQHQNSKSMN
jgi:hypothetical protein